MRHRIRSLVIPYILFAFCIPLSNAVAAGDKTDYTGWETGSRYDNYYNYKERDSLKGKIKKFLKITPHPGMVPGTAFLLREGDEEILVHLCPWSYANPKETRIRKGIKTKVKGSWALINGQDIFIAAKVKQGEDFVFKTRLTKDGTPFWTMNKEQLAREKNSTD